MFSMIWSYKNGNLSVASIAILILDMPIFHLLNLMCLYTCIAYPSTLSFLILKDLIFLN